MSLLVSKTVASFAPAHQTLPIMGSMSLPGVLPFRDGWLYLILRAVPFAKTAETSAAGLGFGFGAVCACKESIPKEDAATKTLRMIFFIINVFNVFRDKWFSLIYNNKIRFTY
jgi:hypothetical protein